MDPQLLALVRGQNGVCGSVQALRSGISRTSLRQAVSSGKLIRVRRGALVEAAAWRGASPDARYDLAVRATLASRGSGDAASHHAALALHGLPLYGFDISRVDLVGDVDRTTRCGRVVVHPRAGAVVEAAGALAMDVPTAVMQATLSTGVAPGVVCADRAVASGQCSLGDLHRAAETLRPVRAHRRLQQLLVLVDPASESVAESRARLILLAAGLPVRSQVQVTDDRGRFVARVDLLVGERVVVEVDGAMKYADDPAGASLFQEKVREDRLRELGFEVVRLTWACLSNPARVVARVRTALARTDPGRAAERRGVAVP